MTCVEHKNLQAYAEGALSGVQRQSVAAHLAACARCRAELALLARMHEALAAQPLLDPPPGFARSVVARLAPAPAPPSLAWLRASLAACWVAGTAVTLWLARSGGFTPRVERLSEYMTAHIELMLAPAQTAITSAGVRYLDYTHMWTGRVADGLAAAARPEAAPWFLAAALIALAAVALYGLFDDLCGTLSVSQSRQSRRSP